MEGSSLSLMSVSFSLSLGKVISPQVQSSKKHRCSLLEEVESLGMHLLSIIKKYELRKFLVTLINVTIEYARAFDAPLVPGAPPRPLILHTSWPIDKVRRGGLAESQDKT